jgi:hypothetical protein
MHRRPVMMTLLAMVCVAACADGRSGQSPATDTAAAQRPHESAVTQPAPVGDTTLSVSQSGNGSYPRFVPGTYELVLDRDQPLFDDSLAVRDLVDRRQPPDAGSARDWRDSIRVLGASFEVAMRNESATWDSMRISGAGATPTAHDSASVMREQFGGKPCEEWRAGGRVILEAEGRITVQHDYRKYCAGKLPAFTRELVVEDPDSLNTCDWKPPVPGAVLHLTCRWGRRGTSRNYHYEFAGDTLMLSSDCDGRDTYVLRLPDASGQYAVKRSSDVSRLEEC